MKISGSTEEKKTSKMDLNIRLPPSVTVVFYILGVCIMLPWNFFITANSYWQYKFRNVTLGDEWMSGELTRLQVAFTPSLIIISNVSIFSFGFITSAITRRVSEETRIYGSLGICLASMSSVLLLSFINTDEWQVGFFGVTMLTIALINVGVSILQASCYGMTGKFPSRCMTSLVSGQALAGVLSSVSQIISLAIGAENPVASAHIYFSFADAFIILTVGSYAFLRKTNHYQQTSKLAELNENNKESRTSFQEYWTILKKIKWMCFSLAFLLMITLSVYPAVQVYVTSVHAGQSKWADVYFQPTITFLLFNVMDMAGREAPRLVQWPGSNGWLFHVIASLRLLFIPLILLCNGGTNKTFPTLFHYDAEYAVINALFAFSGGYFGSLSLVYYPRFVNNEETELAGTIMAALMGVGMITGSCLSVGFVAAWGPNE